MRYIYPANGVVELFYEKPDYLDPDQLIEVSDDFELDPNRVYFVDPETKEISSVEHKDAIIENNKTDETITFESILHDSINAI